MMQIRRAKDRFHTKIDWLDSRHTFSFGGHYHPEHVGFRTLRVINDDRIAPGAGFERHGHREMEIISVVLDGSLEHRDSMGNGTVIVAGEVQRMSAGTGILHSEFNPQEDQGTRLLQIWIRPETAGREPSYEQKRFDDDQGDGALRLLASRNGRDGSVTVNQDVDLWLVKPTNGQVVTHRVRTGRGIWLQVMRGTVAVGDSVLQEGDGASLEGISELSIQGRTDSDDPTVRPPNGAGPTSARPPNGAEVLVFDLA